MQRNISFCGIPIIKVRKTENYEKRYFLGIQYKVKKYARRYHDFIEAFIENGPFVKNRNIQVILNNLGEAVIYARTTRFWHKKDALIFGVRPQHAEIFNMFAPEIPVFYCGEGNLKEKTVVNGNSIEPVLSDLNIIKINNEGKSFWKQWEKYCQGNFKQLKLRKASIPFEVKVRAMNKLKALHINVDKYCFFVPKARSHDLLSDDFWEILETELRKRGYDIVYNSKTFSLSEAYAIAENAKSIIALRSGFNDIICEIKKPQFLIYSHNSWHEDLQPMYSMKNFPWAAKDFITEYNTHSQAIKEIKNDILKRIISYG